MVGHILPAKKKNVLLLSEKERMLFPGSQFVKFRPLNADISRTTLQLICISSDTKNVNINLSAGSVRMSPILAEKRSHQHSQESTVGSSENFKGRIDCQQWQKDTEVMGSAAPLHTAKRRRCRGYGEEIACRGGLSAGQLSPSP